MSKLHEFLENLLSQRFNFFLVFLGFVLVGFIEAQGFEKYLILGFGILICYLLALTIIRGQYKVELILTALCKANPAYKTIAEAAGQKQNLEAKVPHLFRSAASERRIGLIGYWIPFLCVAFLVLLMVYAAVDGRGFVNKLANCVTLTDKNAP